jgi:hypothetical protein
VPDRNRALSRMPVVTVSAPVFSDGIDRFLDT